MSPDSASDCRLRIGHSPDPDDAFMFYPLTQAKVDTKGLEFVDVLRDICRSLWNPRASHPGHCRHRSEARTSPSGSLRG